MANGHAHASKRDGEIWLRQICIPGRYELEIFFGQDNDIDNSAMGQQVYAMLMGWA